MFLNLPRKRNSRIYLFLRKSKLKGTIILLRDYQSDMAKRKSVLPDTDMAIVDYDFSNPWNSVVVAIISCKTSLRGRMAQARYWKLNLVSSDATKTSRSSWQHRTMTMIFP